MTSSPGSSARLALIFSCIGHFYIHMFTAFYFVIVLTLEVEWQRPYHEMIQLWTLGSILVGAAALPAGRLGDVWSVPGMMAVFFLGMGASAIACGLVSGPLAMMMGLAGIGLFAAIYHPIGIPWMIRNADGNTGKLLAVNGIFGSLGSAGAGLIAGVLIDLFGWRAAFMVPGVVALATGIAMVWFIRRGALDGESGDADAADDKNQGRGTLRVFLILLVAMFAGGLIYHGTQTALPKLFAERLQDVLGGGATGVGAMVAVVYIVGGAMQLLGGHLADRYPLKLIYIGAWFVEMIFLMMLAVAAGLGVVGVAIFAVMANLGQLPAENMMLARYTPRRHHGLAFGIKFVLAFGAAPVAIALVSFVRGATDSFEWLFYGLGGAALLISVLAMMLPPTEDARPVNAPAE